MTALAACLTWSDPTPARDRVARMLTAQRMFGPDHSAVEGTAHVALGRGLKRFLPEDVTDRQPVQMTGGRRALVADLRLDNRGDLIAALSLDGAQARLLSDSAILAQAIDHWGLDDTLPRLVGAFAFVLWDRRDESLTLVRDQMGLRPLIHTGRPGFLAVSSMPQGLFALPDCPLELNDARFVDRSFFRTQQGPETLFKGVCRVEPGCLTRLTRDDTASRRWSDLSEIRERADIGFGEAVEAVNAAMHQAVTSQLRSTRGIGCFLSGGLDSGVVAGIAAPVLAARNRPLHCFTAAPSQTERFATSLRPRVDETAQVGRIAERFPNLRSRVFPDDEGALTAPMEQLTRLTMDPIHNPLFTPSQAAMADAARQADLGVLFRATMGNFTFSAGYFGVLEADYLRRPAPLDEVRAVAGLWRSGEMRHKGALRSLAKALLPRPGYRWLLERVSPSEGALLPGVFLTENARDDIQGTDVRANGVDRADMLTRFDMGFAMKAFQVFYGADVRDPAADLRVVRLCLSLPRRYFTHRGEERAIGRALYRKNLSAALERAVRPAIQLADGGRIMASDLARIRSEIAKGCLAHGRFGEVDLDAVFDRALRAPDYGSWPSLNAHRINAHALTRLYSFNLFLNQISGSNRNGNEP